MQLLKFISTILLASILFFSCGNKPTISNETITEKGETKSGKSELATTPLDLITFYSDENKEGISDILISTVAKGKTPILFFTADWCKPCREFKDATKYEVVTQALQDATIILIDTDDDKNGYSADYGVRAIPTFIIVDQDGKAINTITGAAWAENTPENIAPAMADFLKG